MWYGNGFAGEPEPPQDHLAQVQLSRLDHCHLVRLAARRTCTTASAFPMGFSAAGEPSELAQCRTSRRNEESFTDRLADELEQTILEAGPETIGAMIAEPMSVSSGMFPPPASYFPKITKVLKQVRHPAVHRRGRDGLWPLRPHVGDRGHGPRARLHDLRQGHLRRLHADCRHHHG